MYIITLIAPMMGMPRMSPPEMLLRMSVNHTGYLNVDAVDGFSRYPVSQVQAFDVFADQFKFRWLFNTGFCGTSYFEATLLTGRS